MTDKTPAEWNEGLKVELDYEGYRTIDLSKNNNGEGNAPFFTACGRGVKIHLRCYDNETHDDRISRARKLFDPPIPDSEITIRTYEGDV